MYNLKTKYLFGGYRYARRETASRRKCKSSRKHHTRGGGNVLAIVADVIVVGFFTLQIGSKVGILASILFFIVALIFGYFGIKVGLFFRKILCPDYVIGTTSGVMKARIFWAVGPQLIGLIVGIMLAGEVVGIFFPL